MTKISIAKELAKSHFRIDPGVKQIFLIEPLDEKDPDDPIRLLEVVEGTLECGIRPIAFTADPSRGIFYPLIIIEVSPREFKEIRSGKIDGLNSRGWKLGKKLSSDKRMAKTHANN